jgi:hypothetical protein
METQRYASTTRPPLPSLERRLNLVDANNQSFDVPAQDVRIVPSTDFVQVIFRLPDNLAVGTCTVKVKTDTQITSAGTMRIRL